MTIEIDQGSGFCFGVTTAITKAEEKLGEDGSLYCLGDIVHNSREVERLEAMGLKTIDHAAFAALPPGSRVLLRAHGEPPTTYQQAERRGIELVDATCPVVLQLQRRIKREHEAGDSQIAIFGKPGHAEVLGLVGQTEGRAVVLSRPEDAAQLDMTRNVSLFSQTTQPLAQFRETVDYIQTHIQPPATFRYYDTICRQVSGRMPQLLEFCKRHDAILFVSGSKSSNGRVLFEACRSVNPRVHAVEGPEDIQPQWLQGVRSLGICGATSTPKWLMERVSKSLLS